MESGQTPKVLMTGYYYLLGAAIISMGYDNILSRCASVATHIAFSSISRGKSNCCNVAIAVCGNSRKGCAIHLTESHARSYLGNRLPFVYDDPNNELVLQPLLMNSFGGAEMGTCKSQFAAHCAPLVTANQHIIEKLAQADDRYVKLEVIVSS